MRSRFADTFNHDADAPGYDKDVSNEVDPIRAGYTALLDWTARSARIDQRHDVLELGAGTGNLTRLMLPAHRARPDDHPQRGGQELRTTRLPDRGELADIFLK